MEIAKITNKRNILFISFSLLALLIFYTPFREILHLAFYERLYAHMILVPFVSGYFLFLKRKQISLAMDYSFKAGLIAIIIGISFYLIGGKQGPWHTHDNYLSLIVLSALIFWIGGFVLFYGVKAFKIAAFPLLFLLFMVPIPGKALETIIYLLTCGSAEAAYGFFKLTGVPVLREGFSFQLPGLNIEVAEQCSGINSSIALFVASIVAGQLFLRTGWKKAVLALSIFPITILKNGMRIVTLSLLGAYVDPRILSSDLHRKGGIPFFIIALAMLAPILWYLRRSEKKNVRTENKG
ncbi:MAG: exosortase/archaeosortase family protein [Thermodesulfobacteriota bacterium]|jgi:exosortase